MVTQITYIDDAVIQQWMDSVNVTFHADGHNPARAMISLNTNIFEGADNPLQILANAVPLDRAEYFRLIAQALTDCIRAEIKCNLGPESSDVSAFEVSNPKLNQARHISPRHKLTQASHKAQENLTQRIEALGDLLELDLKNSAKSIVSWVEKITADTIAVSSEGVGVNENEIAAYQRAARAYNGGGTLWFDKDDTRETESRNTYVELLFINSVISPQNAGYAREIGGNFGQAYIDDLMARKRETNPSASALYGPQHALCLSEFVVESMRKDGIIPEKDRSSFVCLAFNCLQQRNTASNVSPH